jgi:ComF family protein
LAALIGFFKYDYAESVRDVLPAMLHSFFEQHAQTMASVQAIVPVPLHSSRYAERGFNQAEHIAAAVANYLQVPVIKALDRVRRTKQQARLSKQARMNNVVQAFAVRSGVSLPEHLLLVDDVFTTGSTLTACAHELKRNAQVKTVHAWCLARG